MENIRFSPIVGRTQNKAGKWFGVNNLFKQIIKFVGLSGIGWVLDFCTYAFLGLISANLILNNTISSWVGVTFVFIFATRKVFENNSKIPLRWKYIIYLLYQCVMIFFISKLLSVINGGMIANINVDLIKSFSAIISKILVTPITMVVNFFVMKCVIEKL